MYESYIESKWCQVSHDINVSWTFSQYTRLCNKADPALYLVIWKAVAAQTLQGLPPIKPDTSPSDEQGEGSGPIASGTEDLA